MQTQCPGPAWRYVPSNQTEAVLATTLLFTALTPVPSTTTPPASLAGASCALTGATTAPVLRFVTVATRAGFSAKICV